MKERNIALAITINAIIIFLLYFPRFKDNITLEVIDQLFITFFVVEAIIKMNTLSVKGYFDKGWNKFDFIIVVLSLPTLLTHIFTIPDTSLFLILRLFRVARLVRFVRFIPNLPQVLQGLGRALKASVFVLAALFFLNFLLAIVTCHFFAEVAPDKFGDPIISAYHIFQLFTIEGWNEIPDEVIPLLDKEWLVWLTRFYFGSIVLIGGIFGMSLANAVFVDEMTLDNNDVVEDKIDQLQQQIEELKTLLQNRDGR
jgi:voltage-gated sodium channel